MDNNNTTLKMVALTNEQIEQLKLGFVVNTGDYKLRLNETTKQVMIVASVSSNKKEFIEFNVVPASDAELCSFSNECMDKAIAEYENNGGEDMPYCYCYKSSGYKANPSDKGVMELEEQVKLGVARVVQYRVTKKLENAYYNKCGVVQAYQRKGQPMYYLRDDVKEVTDGLKASYWKEKEAVKVVRAVEDVSF